MKRMHTTAAGLFAAMTLSGAAFADPAMLKQVKSGDKVQFTADRVNGQITVTSIKKSK